MLGFASHPGCGVTLEGKFNNYVFTDWANVHASWDGSEFILWEPSGLTYSAGQEAQYLRHLIKWSQYILSLSLYVIYTYILYICMYICNIYVYICICIYTHTYLHWTFMQQLVLNHTYLQNSSGKFGDVKWIEANSGNPRSLTCSVCPLFFTCDLLTTGLCVLVFSNNLMKWHRLRLQALGWPKLPFLENKNAD